VLILDLEEVDDAAREDLRERNKKKKKDVHFYP